MIKKSKKKKAIESSKIRKEIGKLIAEIARMDYKKVKESDNIRDDLGVDSLMAMEILAAIEKRLGIVIDEAKVFDIVTVKDLIGLVMSCFKKKKMNYDR
jgi:acyl carrier protein